MMSCTTPTSRRRSSGRAATPAPRARASALSYSSRSSSVPGASRGTPSIRSTSSQPSENVCRFTFVSGPLKSRCSYQSGSRIRRTYPADSSAWNVGVSRPRSLRRPGPCRYCGFAASPGPTSSRRARAAALRRRERRGHGPPRARRAWARAGRTRRVGSSRCADQLADRRGFDLLFGQRCVLGSQAARLTPGRRPRDKCGCGALRRRQRCDAPPRGRAGEGLGRARAPR
jgi:hypothetical protein